MIDSILVPIKDRDAVKPDDVMHWDNPPESWSCGLVYGGGQLPRVECNEPLSRIRPNAFQAGQLVVGRSFDGRTVDKHYYKVPQSLTHAHNLHWAFERRAWCRFDENGDLDACLRRSGGNQQ